jgi:hypothetical protein
MSTMALGPAYARLWTATALSNVGDGIRAAAIPLLAAAGRISLGATLALATAVTGAAQLVLGLTGAVTVIAASLALSGYAFAVGNVAVVSMRQRATPANLLGRVTATYRTLVNSAAAVGALLGGIAAAGLGVRAPMLAGAPVLIMAGLLLLAPLRRLTRIPPATPAAPDRD